MFYIFQSFTAFDQTTQLIQYHEKDWLTEEGILSDEHNASILNLDSSTPSYAYGKFACGKSVSRFGRSDCYLNTPKDVCVKNLI